VEATREGGRAPSPLGDGLTSPRCGVRSLSQAHTARLCRPCHPCPHRRRPLLTIGHIASCPHHHSHSPSLLTRPGFLSVAGSVLCQQMLLFAFWFSFFPWFTMPTALGCGPSPVLFPRYAHVKQMFSYRSLFVCYQYDASVLPVDNVLNCSSHLQPIQRHVRAGPRPVVVGHGASRPRCVVLVYWVRTRIDGPPMVKV